MTYSLKLDSFSGLCTILDGERVVATDVSPKDAAHIVEATDYWRNSGVDHIEPRIDGCEEGDT